MNKTIHFQDQLAATSNPDPLLKFWEETSSNESHMDTTRKSQLHEQLVGMKFVRMAGSIPVFMNELVNI